MKRGVLITGGTGLLGQALLAAAPPELEVRATYHRQPPPSDGRPQYRPLEICDDARVLSLVRELNPAVVVQAASIGSIDLAEQHPGEVHRINVGGLRAITTACEAVGARLVFVSSNAVFDGSCPPYAEHAARSAVNRYGRLKIEAEELLEASSVPHVIVRPILMYGWPLPGARGNVVTRWLQEFAAGRRVEVADDIYSMPLTADNCAEAIWAAIRLDRRGVFHVAGADRVTLAEFARETARVFEFSQELVVPVPSATFTTLAPRPRDTSFVTDKMSGELGVRPVGIHEGLAAMRRTRALAH